MADEYLSSEKATIRDLGDGDFGLIYDNSPKVMEIWFNHNFDGSGVNNLVIDAFGKELDLEFCRSEKIAG